MLGAHADWSKDANKRWYAAAALEADGHYLVSAPSMVGCLSSYFRRLRGNLEADAAVLAGFDFPIGLPAQYAAKVGLSNFVDALPRFGRGEWDDSYCPAPSRSRISTKGRFYPISGWRDLLAPALTNNAELSIWPFDGPLFDSSQFRARRNSQPRASR